MADNLFQIWIDLPDLDYQEVLHAARLDDGLYQVREIPFISEEVNYLDIVRCEEDEYAPRLVVEVVKPSSCQTIHITFMEDAEKEEVRECIHELRWFGVTYRRSGLHHFSLNIPPEADSAAVLNNLNALRELGMIVDRRRDSIGAREQTRRHLHHLLSKTTILQDGSHPDPELETDSDEGPTIRIHK